MHASPNQPELTLIDGWTMPQLGLGVWQIPNNQTPTIVQHAIQAGYRLVDTAALYESEEGVGQAIAATDVKRDELFITTKLANNSHGFDEVLRAFDASLNRLGLNNVDLYLIHWPRPSVDRYLETWRAFIRLKEEGRARSIGVSNFTMPTLERIIGETGVSPTPNQIELHPWFQQKEMRAFHAAHWCARQHRRPPWCSSRRIGRLSNP
jgi:2,5-diketo-D-gluconate reductase A